MITRSTPKPVLQPNPIARVEPAPRAKSVHAEGFDLERYETALGTPTTDLESTVAEMVNLVLQSVPCDSKPIRLLLIGIGAGRIEVPFLHCLEGRLDGRAVHADLIDYSRDSFEAAANTIRVKWNIADETAQCDWKEFQQANSTYRLTLADFETWQPQNGPYDVVIAFFVINFFTDWAKGLVKILSLLKQGGVLLFAEDAGDIRFLDNVLTPDAAGQHATDSRHFLEFWKTYYSLRERHGFEWNPLISPGNMKGLTDILSALANLGYLEIVPLNRSHWAWHSQTLTWNDWISLIEGPKEERNTQEVFHCLSCIPTQLRKRLANQLCQFVATKLSSELTFRPMIEAGHRIFAFKAKASLDEQDTRRRVAYVIDAECERLIARRIGQRHPFRLNPAQTSTGFEGFVRRLLSVNELLPNRGAVTISPVNWLLERIGDPDKGTWNDNVPVLFPEPSTIGSTNESRRRHEITYALYWCVYRAAEKCAYANIVPVSGVILRRLRIKLSLEFRVSNSNDANAEIDFGTDGIPCRVCLLLPADVVQQLRTSGAKLSTDVLGQRDIINKLTSLHDRIVRDASRDIEFPKLPLHDLNLLVSQIARDILWNDEAIRDKVANFLKLVLTKIGPLAEALQAKLDGTDVLPRGDTDATALVCQSLAAAAYINTLIGAGDKDTEWRSVLFLPARSYTHQKSNKDGGSGEGYQDDWEVALLGLICYLRADPGVNDKDLDRFVRQHESRLIGKINEFGLEEAVQQASGLVRKEAMNSAIAAILGRVNAHDLGHVLSHATLKDLTPEPRNAYFTWLTRYLRTRMVFAAESANAMPTAATGYPLISGLLRDFCYIKTPSELKDILSAPSTSPVCKHLAQSEDVTDICFKVGRHTSDGVVWWSNQTAATDVTILDVAISLPYGLVGAHAFYCIVENVIRNGAKYASCRSGEKKLTVHLLLEEQQSPLAYRVTIWDDHSAFTEERFQQICRFFPPFARPDSERNSFYRTVLEGLDKANEMPWRLVGPDGTLGVGGFGIKEMRITAAWLRHERAADVLWQEDEGYDWDDAALRWERAEDPANWEHETPVLRPIVVSADGQERKDSPTDGEAFMGYQFCLLKAIPVAIYQPGSDHNSNDVFVTASSVPDLIKKSARSDIAVVASQDSALTDLRDPVVRNSLPFVLYVEDGENINRDSFAPSTIIPKTDLGLVVNRRDWQPVVSARLRWLRETLPSCTFGCALSLILQFEKREPYDSAAKAWICAALKLQAELDKVFLPPNSIRLLVCRDQEDAKCQINSVRETTLLIFDDHDRFKTGVLDADKGKLWERVGFYQNCNANDPAVLTLRNPPASLFDCCMSWIDFLQAALMRTAIVDERVSEAYTRASDDYRSNWEKAGLLRPESPGGGDGHLTGLISFVRGQADHGDGGIAFRDWLKRERVSLLLMHQGVLDKVCGGDAKKVAEWLAPVEESGVLVVLESDRGKELLPRLPHSARFLPFSSVQPWLFGSPSRPNKLHLIKSLLSARTSRRDY